MTLFLQPTGQWQRGGTDSDGLAHDYFSLCGIMKTDEKSISVYSINPFVTVLVMYKYVRLEQTEFGLRVITDDVHDYMCEQKYCALLFQYILTS